MTETRTEMLRRVVGELTDLADQDLGDGQPAEPLTATRLAQAQETLTALYDTLLPQEDLNAFQTRLRLILAAGDCFEASLKLKMGISITAPFPWEPPPAPPQRTKRTPPKRGRPPKQRQDSK